MKKLYFLLLFVAVLSHSFAQYSSKIDINPILREHYDADVKNSCLQWVLESDSNLFYSSAEIPPLVLDSVWQALSAVYYEFDMPERDSVIDMYCIHQSYKEYLVKQVLFVPDFENPNIISWLNQDPGYPILDSIISKYEFNVEIKDWYVTLRTEQEINMYYVLALLKLIDGIEIAEPNYNSGIDGNRFTYRSIGADKYLYFNKAWGDCLAGCYAHHIWQFKIDENNNVEYIGTLRQYDEDNSIGEPWNCNITGIMEDDELVYMAISPNPAQEYVSFSIPFENKTEYRILNINGQIIKKGYLIGDDNISVSELKKGIYLIQLNSINNIKTYKISKI
ncbi:T9SS type A sorting domain-containing protein [Lentimicrobium sp. L6]|uniref:T9SS type A sorting domain-containing protein n=1 Tax=Lentimicrobium sp. L6 TaxID=2735916 RepID=UPI001555C1B4|nr:T9SS type A sorting domain-containing protein [Lentimicrobium sp. L6]NPD86320.1 T9SS type A sorting domain-containing protein [Lentimicrobium sp. L6]